MATKNNAALDAMRSYARQNRGQASSSGSGYVTPTKQSAIEEFANIISNSRNNPKPTVPAADVSAGTSGPATIQTTTAPEATVQPIQTPELDKATGNGWEDTQALGRKLTPRMSASQILARNMSAAPEDVTPQMQAEYQKAAQAEREYKTRRRNAMAAGAQAVAEANPLFSADPDEVMRTGMPDIDNKGNTLGAFNRGFFGQSAMPEGMTEAEQKMFQRGSKAQDVFVNAPAIIAEFGGHAIDTFLHPEAEHTANAYDPGIVQRASRAGDIVGLTTATGLGKASNEIAEFVTMVEDAATGGRWRDPLNSAAMAEFDKLQGVVENEAKDWTAGQKKAFMYGSEAVRMVPSIVLAWMTGGTSTAASLGPEAAGRAAQFSQAFTRYVTGLAHDPQFYLTSMQVAGDSYASALEKGVDRNTAALFGTLNGVLNGAIEIGGMQDVPGLIRGTGLSNGLLHAILSIPTEIREEVMQGAVEKALENVVLGENNQFISVKDPDAIISLSRAAQEGEGAAIISALMGGGNVALNTALNVYNNAVQQQNPLTQTILANQQEQQEQGNEFNAPQPVQSNEQARGNIPAPAAQTSAQTEAQARVTEILSGAMSNSRAESIINDPELRTAFEEMSGEQLTGSKSEQRAAVKEYAAQMETTSQEETTAPVQEMPMPEAQPATPTSPIALAALNNEQQNAPQTQTTEPAAPSPAPTPAQQTQPTAQTTQQSAAPQGRTTPMRVEPAPADAEGTRLSASVETVQNSPVTSNEFSALIDQTVSDGGYRYIPITNDATTQKATQRIQNDGWQKARADWTADVRQGKTSAEMMATGALLYNNAVNAGDLKAAAEIMADYVAVGTNTAQALQARKIIQSMQPEMRLYMIERSVERMIQDLNLPEGVTISEELKEEYRKAKTDEERDAVVTKMQKEVAAQVPSTFKDKWTALRYVNMLGNFRTQARNIFGNTSMSLLTSAKNAIKTLLETGARIYTGGKYERTTSLTADKDLVQAAREYYNANSEVIDGEGKYSDNRTATGFMKGVEEQKTIFGSGENSEWASNLLSGILGRDVEVKKNVLEDYRRATNWAMKAGDTLFIGARFARTLAGYLQANGIDAATFTGIQNGSIQPTAEQQELIDRAVNYATKEAQEATFHDNNALSNWVSKIGRKEGTPKGIKAISEGIMPFRKTPANVLIRAEEYSPLGFANAAVQMWQAKKGKGNVTSSDILNSFSKAFTGTGLFALGMILRNAGWLRGHEDDEKQEEFDKLQGEQDYSLVFPDGTNITLDWLSPTSIPLFLGVQMQDARMEGGFSIEEALQALSGITDPLIQMSMLQGVNDTFDNIKYSNNNLVQLGLSAMVSYLTQGLTNTMLGQIERIGEDRRTTTYTDANTRLGRSAQRTLGKALNKVPIPGVDYNQIEYLDAWGRPDMSESSPFARAFNNLINPGYVSQNNSTEVDDELQRLYDAGMTNVFPQRIEANDPIPVYDEHGQRTGERRLTADEYVQVQREAGQTKLRMVKDLMASPMYDAMSDDARAKAISSIYEYADYEAKRAVEPSMEDKYSDVAKLSNIPAYFATKNAFADAAGNRWNRDYDELDGIMDSWGTLAHDVQKMLTEKVDNLGKVLNAYQGGVSVENWYKAYDAKAGLVPFGDHKDVAEWQEYQAMANVSTDEDMDVILRDYLEGSSYDRYMAVRNEGVSARAWADAMAEAGKSEPLPGKDTVAEWQKYQAIASGADAKTADAIFKANLADSTYARYTFARDAGITPQQWADTNASVAQLPVLDGNKAVANWQKVNYVGGSNMTDAQKDALMILYFDKGEGNKVATYDKYMLCRDAGFAPVHIAKFYEIMQTAQGVDKDGDGKTDSGTKKKAILAAAMAYGFNEKNAERLYNMWQNGHW